MENEFYIDQVYEWLKNYVSFSEHYEQYKRIGVKSGLRLLIDEGAFRGYEDIRKTLLEEQHVLLPISTLKALAVRRDND